MGQVERQQAMIDEINEREAPDGDTALSLLQNIYRNKLMPLPVRMRAASLAVQYEVPKLGVIAYSNIDPAEFAKALDRAIQRSGKEDEVKVIEFRNDDGTNK
jgi:hypothetical protein